MNVLLRYLAGNQASVLENTLVEKEQVCSGVYYECESRPTTVIQITLTSVDTEKLEQVEARFFDLLTEIAQSPIDLEYMRDCIQLEKRQVKFEAEGSGQAFVNPIIKDFLFGNRDGSTLRADLQNLNVYDTLEAWDDQQWRHWLKQWMAEAHHITVIGKPSSILPGKIESQEKARIATRKEKLGERGLKELEERLAAAKIENEKEIPKEVVSQLQTPNTTSIHFINTTSARSGAARKLGPLQNPVQRVIDQDDDLPLFIHFEHIQSNFVYLTIVLCTEAIPIPLRPLLGIYMNNFFSTPLMRDGKKLDFARVIMDLERDTVGYSAESGQNIGNPEVITIKLQAEVERYQTVIQWLRDLMFSSIFDVERLLSTTTKLLADIPDQKRDGSEMKNAVELMVDTSPSSITRACSTLVAGVYLKSVKHLLKKDPDVIVRQLKEINATLFQPSNFRILVVADIERLTNPVTSWDALIKGLENSGTLQPIDTPISRLSDQGRNPGNTAYVVPITSVDSSYAVAVAKGPSSYSDPAIPALMVAISYLNAIEGPIYKAIRGTGLAYGVAFRHYISSGQVSLSTSQSANLLGAFTASKEVVQSFVSGERALDPFDLEGAVSSIVLNFANTESTMANAAEMSFIRQVMRGLPKDWPTVILERVRKVEPEEIRNVMRDFVLPIFDSKTANLFVTCAPIMESTLVMGFRGIGFPTESKPLAFFQDDYGLKEEEGADEDEEDEDEDDEDDDEDEEEGEVDGVAEDRKDGNV